MDYTNLHGAREPGPTNNSGNEITQFLYGYGEQGLGGPCELANRFLIHWTHTTASHPKVQSELVPVDKLSGNINCT